MSVLNLKIKTEQIILNSFLCANTFLIHSTLPLVDVTSRKSKFSSYFYRGLNGQKYLDTIFLKTRGQKYLDGDYKRIMKAVFYWAPVFVCLFFYLSMFISSFVYRKNVLLRILYLFFIKIEAPGSNFSLCIVMERNNIVSDIENLDQAVSGDFVYHRWDLNRWPAPFCRHFSRYATQGLFIFFVIG